jgi:protocatechuate 3,4-dioxygenase beta subunit
MLAATAIAGAQFPPTPDHIEGPFYGQGVPEGNDLYRGTGKILRFHGGVTDTELKPLSNVEVEFWHANEEGRYDNDDPANLPAPNTFFCRGKWKTQSDGSFRFRTVLPGNYPIGPNVFRAKHIHFKIYPLGYEPLTTEVVLLPDEYAERDKFFKIPLGTQLEGLPPEQGKQALRAYFNFILMPLAPRPSPYVGYAMKAAYLSLPEES